MEQIGAVQGWQVSMDLAVRRKEAAREHVPCCSLSPERGGGSRVEDSQIGW